MDDNRNRNGALVERGVITGIESAGYIVASLDRKDIVSPPIGAMDDYYAMGDMVLFVLFSDGTGKILCRA